MLFDSRSPDDAIDLLKQDHRKVDELFAQFNDTSRGAQKVSLAQRICEELTVHAMVEEKIFYPALRRAFDQQGDDLLDEAEVEHRTLKMLIAEIDGSGADSKLFEANVCVLEEYVKHHVREEENEIMPKARASSLDLDALGKRMQKLKAQLQEKLVAKAPRKQAARGRSTRVKLPKLDARGRRKSPATKRANGSNGSRRTATARKANGKATSRSASPGRKASSNGRGASASR